MKVLHQYKGYPYKSVKLYPLDNGGFRVLAGKNEDSTPFCYRKKRYGWALVYDTPDYEAVLLPFCNFGHTENDMEPLALEAVNKGAYIYESETGYQYATYN